MNESRVRWSLDRIVDFLVGAGALVALAGFVAVTATGGADHREYRVDFSSPGQTCDATTLYINSVGEQLVCGNGMDTPLTQAEQAEVLKLAARLGVDRLSNSDMSQISSRVGEIARAHGDVDKSEGPWPRFFAKVVIVGLVMLLFAAPLHLVHVTPPPVEA